MFFISIFLSLTRSDFRQKNRQNYFLVLVFSVLFFLLFYSSNFSTIRQINIISRFKILDDWFLFVNFDCVANVVDIVGNLLLKDFLKCYLSVVSLRHFGILQTDCFSTHWRDEFKLTDYSGLCKFIFQILRMQLSC